MNVYKVIIALVALLVFGFAHSEEKGIDLTYESPILVRKGAVEITLADFVAYLDRRVPAESQRALIASASRIEAVLENIALTEGFLERVKQRGMVDDPVFRARLYQVALREARDAYREAVQADIELDSYEAQAREMYLVEPERFSQTKTVDMEHILVAVNAERTEIEAMKRVIDIHERLTAGEDFVAVAKEFSDDPTFSENRGLLENLEVSDLVPSVASAVDSLEVNELSSPIQSRFGWHIIRIKQIRDAGQMTWEEAKPVALELARNLHLTESFERILREVNAPPLQFAPGAVKIILDHYGVEGFGIPELGQDGTSEAADQ